MNISRLPGNLHHVALVVCLLFMVQLPLRAQTHFLPGFVVTAAGDTLNGFVNYKEWSINPTSFSFKVQANSPTVTELGLSDFRYLEIADREAYQYYLGPVTMNPVDLEKHTYLNTSTTGPVPLFLKVHVAGSFVNLLSYTDQLKTRYFIQTKEGSQPQELHYNMAFAPGSRTRVVEQKGYVGQLQHLAKSLDTNSSQLQRKIESAKYSENDLEKIILSMNGSEGRKDPVIKALKPKTRFFAGMALNSSAIEVERFIGLENAASNPASVRPRLAVGFDVFRNKYTQQFYLRMEFAATSANYHLENKVSNRNGYYNTYSYKVKQQTASFSPQLMYTLFNRGNFKHYLGLAASINLANYPENTHRIESYYNDGEARGEPAINEIRLPLKSFWPSYSIRTGVIVFKKLEISALYSPPTPLSEFSPISIKQQTFAVGANYLLHQ